VGNAANPLAARVVDPDLGTDVPLRLDRDPPDVTTLCQQRLDVTRIVEALVVEGEHQPRRTQVAQQLGESSGRLPAGVVTALSIAAVDPLARDAVLLWRVPADERFPHVVVGEVGMIVVGRIDVHEVDIEVRCELVRVLPKHRSRRARDNRRHAQLELVIGSGSPRLQVRHLQAGGAVDAVGGLEQRREHDPPVDGREPIAVDRRPDRVDPPAVVWLHVAGPLAERLREVPILAGKRRKLRQNACQPGSVDRSVRCDVGMAQRLRVRGEVVRDHFEPELAQRLPDPGGASEQVAGRAHGQKGRSEPDQRHQRPFRTDVLDHSVVSLGPADDVTRLARRGIPPAE